MTWRGIVGKGFTPAEFETYVHTIKFGAWRPSFVVVHNTSAPTLALYQSWLERGHPTGEQWLRNLEGYYRDQMGWSAGPHLFVAPDKIYAFTPLNVPGTHSPSWNSRSIGVETVGEYETEVFADPVKSNLIAALATVHKLFGLDPDHYQRGVRGLHFHKEDPNTTHRTCPGKHIVKADLVTAVVAAMHEPGEHPSRLASLAPQDDVSHLHGEVLAEGEPRTMSRIAAYMPWIIEDEGRGLEVRASEPGGAVNLGISMATFRAWRAQHGKPEPTLDDLGRLSDDEAAAIYDALYYRPVRGPDLPLGIDYCVLDSAINNGVTGAIRLMQQTLDVHVDGVLGPATLHAAQHAKAGSFVMNFCRNRLDYMRRSPEWPRFGKGWTNRVNRVEGRALNLTRKI